MIYLVYCVFFPFSITLCSILSFRIVAQLLQISMHSNRAVLTLSKTDLHSPLNDVFLPLSSTIENLVLGPSIWKQCISVTSRD